MYQGGIFLRGKCSKIYSNNSTGNWTWDVRVHYVVKTRSTLDSIFAIIEIKTRKINFISKIYSWSLTYPRNFSVKRRSEPFQSPWWTLTPNLLGTWTFLSCTNIFVESSVYQYTRCRLGIQFYVLVPYFCRYVVRFLNSKNNKRISSYSLDGLEVLHILNYF